MDSSLIFKRRVLGLSTLVFVIAIAVRLSSMSESFWVDELHSAWSVWGSLADVFPRSAAGHQSPIYFAGLWIWKQLFGGSEFALRMSSVLALAASSAVMVVGIASATRSLIAGTVAGLVLALESSALFFGTELRPYAIVILLSSGATICFVRIIAGGESGRNGGDWLGLTVSMTLSVLIQPTSIGVMVCFPVALFVLGPCHMKIGRNCFAALAVMATAVIFLWFTTLSESWGRRGDWATFATATSLWQVWSAWDWTWLLIAPLGLTAFGRASRRTTWTLATTAIVATAIYWFVSWAGWVPIWHRRYFVAALPVLAGVVGGSVSSRSSLTGWIGAVAILVGLTVHQKTLPRLLRNPADALVVRGENWRSAVRWVNENRGDGDRVYLDGGLIEGKTDPSPDENAEQREYLSFPVRGPYQIDADVIPVDASLRGVSSAASTNTFVVTRRPAKLLETDRFSDAEIRAFGGVSVVKLPAMVDGGLK